MRTKQKLIISTVFLVCLLNIVDFSAIASLPEYSNTYVLFDSQDRTTVKTTQIIKDLLDEANDIRYVAIENLDQYRSVLLTTKTDRIIHIFHGTQLGMLVDVELISWSEISSLVDRSTVEVHRFQSCFSDFINSETKAVYGNSGRVDALIAGMSSAYFIAKATERYSTLEKINQIATLLKDDLIKRAISPIEPLWTNHDQLSKIAIELLDDHDVQFSEEYDSNKDRIFDWIFTDSTMYTEMKEASLADEDDGIIDLSNMDSLDQLDELLSNEEVRNKWLKHLGGSIEINHFPYLEPIATWYGTVAQSAENAFTTAVEYWKAGNFLDGAKHLSYAAHYLQDASQPFHTKNYRVDVSTAILLSAIKVWCLNIDHNNFEKYVTDKWNEHWVKPLDYYGNPILPPIHPITDVSETVSELASISKNVSLAIMDSPSDLDPSNADLEDALQLLMKETVSRCAGLYKKFAEEVALGMFLTPPSDIWTNGQIFRIPETTSITLAGIVPLKSTAVIVYIGPIGSYSTVSYQPSLTVDGGHKKFEYTILDWSWLSSVIVETSYTIKFYVGSNNLEYSYSVRPPTEGNPINGIPDYEIDSDFDSMPDIWELTYSVWNGLSPGLDPNTNDSGDDLDNDGLPNHYEWKWGTDPSFDDSGLDTDDDGLTNLIEFDIGTNPTKPDTDDDGMPDEWEYTYSEWNGYSPGLDPNTHDSGDDLDSDDLTNLYEYLFGYNPTVVNLFGTVHQASYIAWWEGTWFFKSSMRYNIYVPGWYYIKVEYRINGGSWVVALEDIVDRDPGYYVWNAGGWYGNAGDTISMKWSIYNVCGDIRYDTRTESVTMEVS